MGVSQVLGARRCTTAAKAAAWPRVASSCTRASAPPCFPPTCLPLARRPTTHRAMPARGAKHCVPTIWLASLPLHQPINQPLLQARRQTCTTPARGPAVAVRWPSRSTRPPSWCFATATGEGSAAPPPPHLSHPSNLHPCPPACALRTCVACNALPRTPHPLQLRGWRLPLPALLQVQPSQDGKDVGGEGDAQPCAPQLCGHPQPQAGAAAHARAGCVGCRGGVCGWGWGGGGGGQAGAAQAIGCSVAALREMCDPPWSSRSFDCSDSANLDCPNQTTCLPLPPVRRPLQ